MSRTAAPWPGPRGDDGLGSKRVAHEDRIVWSLPGGGGPKADVRGFGSVLSRRRWTAIAVALLVSVVALIFSMSQTPIYESEATVLIQVPPGQASQTAINMATEKQIAGSSAVARLVIRNLHLTLTPRQALNGLSLAVPVDTEILRFTYSAPKGEIAQQRAQTFAESYLQFRREELLTEVVAAESSLEDRIRFLTARLTTVEGNASAQPTQHEAALIRSESSSLITQIGILQQKLADLTPTSQVFPGGIVDPATLPGSPARPNIPLNGVLGVLAGLMLGVGAAIVHEYADDRIRDSQDLEQRLGKTVLGAIPSTNNQMHPPSVVVLAEPDSFAAEAFRQLRTNLVFAAVQSSAGVIIVTSAAEEDAITFTVANLGIVLARSGKRVILVSADLRRPRLEDVFHVPAEHGLVDVLVGDAGALDSLQMPPIENLAILPSGSTPSRPSELLGSDAMSALLAELRGVCDYVLVEAPPLLWAADAAAMVPACDAVLVAAEARTVTRTNVSMARQQLDQVRANVLGAVLLNAHD
jgi:polysaccharide biosynthesis transport protein